MIAGVSEGDLAQAMKRAYVAAYRWLGAADEARDAGQEAMLRAVSASSSYDRSRPFYPWFYRILRNHCMDRLNGRKRSHLVSSDMVEMAVSPSGSPEFALLQTERQHALMRAIDALDGDLREIIELRHFQDLSYEEMAETLDCPVGTVMSRLYRARRELRLGVGTNIHAKGGEASR